MDLAQAFAAPEPVSFGGREFSVRQLTLNEWAKLQAWLKTAAPSPVTQVLRAVQEAADLGIPLSADVRDAAFAHAQEAARAWPPVFGGRAWLLAIDTVPGGPAAFVRHVLAAAGVGLTDREAQELVDRAGPSEFGELVRVAYYGDPPSAPLPKAEAPGGMTSPTTGAPPSTS